MTIPEITDPTQQPGGVQPLAATKKKKKKRLIIGIIVAVVVILGGVGAIVASKTETASASVGACIKITSPTMNPPTTSQEPCSSAAAIYVVTETGGSDVTCDPSEASYTEGTSTKVCLRYNLAVGECVNVGDGASSVPKKVDCSAPEASTAVKVVSLITDSSDATQCPAGSTGMALVKRNIVYCLAANS